MDLAQQEGDLTIILPAYNEEQAIGLVIDEIRSLPIHCSILVVDNNSTDSTFYEAHERGVRVATEPLKGKGNAMRRGFGLVDTPFIIMVNADYTYPLEYIQTIYGLLKRSNYDVVVGCRQLKERGSISSANTLGNFLLSLLASVLYRYRINDVCSGLWGFRKGTLENFNVTSRGFTLEADLFINTMRNKQRICQIPVGYRPRLNRSKAKLKIWDGFKISWFLIKRRFR